MLINKWNVNLEFTSISWSNKTSFFSYSFSIELSEFLKLKSLVVFNQVLSQLSSFQIFPWTSNLMKKIWKLNIWEPVVLVVNTSIKLNQLVGNAWLILPLDNTYRVTHIPTGLAVFIQDDRTQHTNKAKALAVRE